MRTFTCDLCGLLTFFHNSACTRCHATLRFDPAEWALRAAGDDDRHCGNQAHGCNWLVIDGQNLCESCRMTRTIPPQDDPEAVTAWERAEAAKRRLLYQTGRLGLDLGGVQFDLLSSRQGPVVTGHDDGVITLDLAEADDEVLARMRSEMGEAYRTVLGHFRHEIGHALWRRYVADGPHLASFRDIFGNEQWDYPSALDHHYAHGPPDGWRATHVSAYATAHPWEDVAETIAHYLHITDVLESAAAIGVRVDAAGSPLNSDPVSVEGLDGGFLEVLDEWLPLATALNEVNRSMGHGDLYPFVLADPVVVKLAWVHRLFGEVAGPSRLRSSS